MIFDSWVQFVAGVVLLMMMMMMEVPTISVVPFGVFDFVVRVRDSHELLCHVISSHDHYCHCHCHGHDRNGP